MLEMSEKARSLINNHNKNDLQNDETLLMALLYSLLIIGEAAANISRDFKEEYGAIPWKEIIGMRNWLVHGYFKTDVYLIIFGLSYISLSVPPCLRGFIL